MAEDVFQVLKANPAVSGTLGGPTPAAEAAIEERKRQLMAQGPPGPNPAAVAAQAIGGTAGALMAPEAAAATVFRFAPDLVKNGVMFLTRGISAGLGQAAADELVAPQGETPEEARHRRLVDLVAGPVGEGVGAGLTAGARAAGKVVPVLGALQQRLRPRNILEPGAEAVQNRLEQFGETLLPGQMTKGFGIDTVQNFLEASFLGGGVMGARKQSGIEAAQAAIDDAMPKVVATATPQQAGQIIEDAIAKPLEAQKQAVRAAYSNLDREVAAAGSAPVVDLVPALTSFESQFATRIAKGDPAAIRIQRYLETEGQRQLTFKEADEVRGLLLDLSRSRDPQVAPGVKSYAGKVAGDVDKAIEQAALNAGALGQGVFDAMKTARATRKLQSDFFNEELIGPLLEKAAPEKVADTLFQQGNPTQIESVRRIVYEPRFRAAIGGDPDAYWGKIQSAWLTDKRQQAGEVQYGALSGERLREAMTDSRGTFEALFPDKAQRDNLLVSARALEMMQSRAGGSRSGSVLAQMTQAREVGQLGNALVFTAAGWAAAKGDVTRSAAIILSPYIAAKAFGSKTFSRWLMQKALTRSERWSSNFGSVMAQGIDALVRANIPFSARDDSGAVTTYDPRSGASGPAAPTGKPTSKIRPQP